MEQAGQADPRVFRHPMQTQEQGSVSEDNPPPYLCSENVHTCNPSRRMAMISRSARAAQQETSYKTTKKKFIWVLPRHRSHSSE